MYPTARELSNAIREARGSGDFQCAIYLCKEGVQRYKNSHFYSKILGDIYMQVSDYENALSSYLDYLRKINNPDEFKNFVPRYLRFIDSTDEELRGTINKELKGIYEFQDFNLRISHLMKQFVASYLSRESNPVKSINSNKLKQLLTSPKQQLSKLKKCIQSLEESNPELLIVILDEYVLKRTTRKDSYAVDCFILSIYEKMNLFDEFFNLATDLLTIKLDPQVIRSYFRVSRKQQNISLIKALIDKYPSIENMNQFPIMYELIYYYNEIGSIDRRDRVLKTVEKHFAQSVPINRTLANFYLQFGLIDEARRINDNLSKLRTFVKFQEEEIETNAFTSSLIERLQSENEQAKRLAAISQLTIGFSHEIGQPVTNIRYMVQYHMKKLKEEFSVETVLDIFNDILTETERMGDLIKRLSPLTSRKKSIERFDISDRINELFSLRKSAFSDLNISAKVTGPHVKLTWDTVKFDQIFRNLIENSLHAIRSKNSSDTNFINVKIQKKKSLIIIRFQDSGIGISMKDRDKIFQPFHTTKEAGEGEGLGLFIVWNLLMSQGGHITLDKNSDQGASFKITIDLTKGEQNEQTNTTH